MNILDHIELLQIWGIIDVYLKAWIECFGVWYYGNLFLYGITSARIIKPLIYTTKWGNSCGVSPLL